MLCNSRRGDGWHIEHKLDGKQHFWSHVDEWELATAISGTLSDAMASAPVAPNLRCGVATKVVGQVVTGKQAIAKLNTGPMMPCMLLCQT